ncbi:MULTISPECIES: mechanosensitive ion channel family protein [Pandoraea]|uniref:Mechanosensitive ion channel protein MscS n=1 Tax=Pandoraea nosoerga TaxID=2508296 RepID=A0A5E4WXT7_9BURK|nr:MULTISPECIES: mechanosensitive ion channel family protein [Pandoraea]VVE29391.1 mechanosensitive ion channel protein MscS [Pandoraea nosoerga]
MKISTLSSLKAFESVSPADWVFAAIAVAASYAIMSGILRLALGRFGALTRRLKSPGANMFAEVLGATRQFVLLFAALLIGLKSLDLGKRWDAAIVHCWTVLFCLQLALWVNRAVNVWQTRRMQHRTAAPDNPVIVTMTAWTLRVLAWAVLVLAMLANFGVNITAFVASLGIGGVAVALAVQNVLSDLFASLAIGLDKPFEVGDFIVFSDVAGTIERIGLKTTRIRSLSGEEIICGNTELLKNTLHNYKRMSERRIVFTFSLSYYTVPDKLARVPAMVKRSVEASGKTRFDRAHFKQFGVSSLDFEVVYFVLSPDYNLYMDLQQDINLALMREFLQEDIRFAIPASVQYYAQAPEPPADAAPAR